MTGSSSSNVVHLSNQALPDSATSSQESGGNMSTTGAPVVAPVVSQSSQHIWPADTDIRFSPGKLNKVILTAQAAAVRIVIQDAMELVRADLMFRCAYPDATYTIATIRASLIEAAARYPNTATVRRRLLFEEHYMMKIVPLVSFSVVSTTLLTRFINRYVLGSRFTEVR